MTKVSHAVTNVGWTAEEVDALNTLPQRYRHLFPEGYAILAERLLRYK